jgi:hypothetical protein
MTATEAVSKIRALRKLTQETGVVTKRAQNRILVELDETTLATVALELNGELNANHTAK